ARTFALLALAARDRPLHAVLDTGSGTDRDVRLHPSLPERTPAVQIARVHRPPHAVFVVAHISIRHRDGVDVRIEKARIPRHRIRDAVDVVPSTRIEPHEMRDEHGADLNDLITSPEPYAQDMNFDRSIRDTALLFKGRHHAST